VRKLIGEDGSFSQHSVTYHRMMLDTIAYCEFWRRNTKADFFSRTFYSRAKAATNWLWQFTDTNSGNSPNLGANDGSMLNHLHHSTFRDFRPSLNLAGALFLNTLCTPVQNGSETLWWFNLKPEMPVNAFPERDSMVFSGGYVKLKSDGLWALVRFPYFRFRPSHNDVLHVDLWYQGRNLLCDAGTYSYNPPEELKNLDLSSVHHHNTVSFDGREQMPRLSRFLLANWLKYHEISDIKKLDTGETEWTGAYFDHYKNRHERTVKLSKNSCVITDTLSGNFKKATIGFNIDDLNCRFTENRLHTTFGFITIPGDSHPHIEESHASDHYFEIHAVTRLIIEVDRPGTYVTEVFIDQDFKGIK
jgi:hypothetical protein